MTCRRGWLCSPERARGCFLRGHVPDPFAFACWRCLLDCGLLRPQPGSALRATQAHHGQPQLSSSRTSKLVHRRKAFVGSASSAQNFQITQLLSALLPSRRHPAPRKLSNPAATCSSAGEPPASSERVIRSMREVRHRALTETL